MTEENMIHVVFLLSPNIWENRENNVISCFFPQCETGKQREFSVSRYLQQLGKTMKQKT